MDQSRLDDLLSIANRKDANGEYLFSGYKTQTQPFSKGAANVQYAGDQGVRLVQTSSTQQIADGHSGYDVFMQVDEGNGTFVTSANAAPCGSISCTMRCPPGPDIGPLITRAPRAVARASAASSSLVVT